MHVDAIRTPMLVIHGDLDYRVPVGEALRLWSDLKPHGKEASSSTSRTRTTGSQAGHVRAWYETVFAFLAEHVLGEHWEQPDLL